MRAAKSSKLMLFLVYGPSQPVGTISAPRIIALRRASANTVRGPNHLLQSLWRPSNPGYKGTAI